MKAINLFFLLLFFAFGISGQKKSVTFYDDVFPVIQKHCTNCHYVGGPAPFSLLTYNDIHKRSKFIAYVTGIKYMPPWKADAEFRHFRNENILTQPEIDIIQKWATGKMKSGKKPVLRPIKKSKAESDKTIVNATMKQVYQIPSDNQDDFRFFHIPLALTRDQYITGIEFRPGNKKRVHHSRIMLDTTKQIAGINGLSEKDPSIYKYQTKPLADEFLYGWVPGNFTFRFPVGFGKKIYRNSDIILNMHYSPSVLKGVDQSHVRLYLDEAENILREVKTLILRETDISNQPFFIPAGNKPVFYMSSGVIQKDMSLLTIQPHAHLLGKSFRAFAITGDGDMIPLIKIDKWDFNWQTTYEFEKMIHIPAGAVIIMEGQYDNTVDNPVNPNFPPLDTGYGWRTVDEMMNLIFYYSDYMVGDETLHLQYRD